MDLDRRSYSECDSPVIRFYGWLRPCVTSGYFIDPFTMIDRSSAESSSVEVVKRPTGGGLAFHAVEDISYCAVAPVGTFGESLMDDYFSISERLVKALNKAGYDAAVNRGGKAGSRTDKGLCFLSPQPHEVTVSGNKVIGSAQRRGRKSVLQQGTVQIGSFPEELLYKLLGKVTADRLAAGSTSLSMLKKADRDILLEALTTSFLS